MNITPEYTIQAQPKYKLNSRQHKIKKKRRNHKDTEPHPSYIKKREKDICNLPLLSTQLRDESVKKLSA